MKTTDIQNQKKKNRFGTPVLLLFAAATVLLLSYACEQKPTGMVYVYKNQDPDTLDAYQITPMNTDSLYYNPEKPPFTPAKMYRKEALDEVEFKRDVVGFEKVYFGSGVIERILDTDNAVGLRLYNAMEAEGDTITSLIAIAVDSLRNNLYSTATPYVRSDGIVSGNPQTSTLTEVEARLQFTYASEAKSGFYVYFSKSALTGLINNYNAEGLWFIPGQRRFALSSNAFQFSLIAAPGGTGGPIAETGTDSTRVLIMDESDESDSVEEGSGDTSGKIYEKSKQPCPPDCWPYDSYNPGG